MFWLVAWALFSFAGHADPKAVEADLERQCFDAWLAVPKFSASMTENSGGCVRSGALNVDKAQQKVTILYDDGTRMLVDGQQAALTIWKKNGKRQSVQARSLPWFGLLQNNREGVGKLVRAKKNHLGIFLVFVSGPHRLVLWFVASKSRVPLVLKGWKICTGPQSVLVELSNVAIS